MNVGKSTCAVMRAYVPPMRYGTEIGPHQKYHCSLWTHPGPVRKQIISNLGLWGDEERLRMSYRSSECHVLVKGTNENILLVFIMVMLMFWLNINNLRQYSTFFSPLLRGGSTANRYYEVESASKHRAQTVLKTILPQGRSHLCKSG